jgi:hypothetical protein
MTTTLAPALTKADIIERLEYERDRFNDLADTFQIAGLGTALVAVHRDAAKRMDTLIQGAAA